MLCVSTVPGARGCHTIVAAATDAVVAFALCEWIAIKLKIVAIFVIHLFRLIHNGHLIRSRFLILFLFSFTWIFKTNAQRGKKKSRWAAFFVLHLYGCWMLKRHCVAANFVIVSNFSRFEQKVLRSFGHHSPIKRRLKNVHGVRQWTILQIYHTGLYIKWTVFFFLFYFSGPGCSTSVSRSAQIVKCACSNKYGCITWTIASCQTETQRQRERFGLVVWDVSMCYQCVLQTFRANH